MIIYCSSLDASLEPPYSPGSCSSDDNKLPFHYLLLDSIILKIYRCLPDSSKELELCNNISKKIGLAKCLEINCIATGCDFIYSTYTSTRVTKTNQAEQKPIRYQSYHCCEKLHHWRKDINFVQKLNCRDLSTKAMLMAPPHANISLGYIQH